MKRFHWAALTVLLFLVSAASAQTVVPVPWTPSVVSGSQRGPGPAVTYRAYQASGDPFRILCQEPCPLSEDLIFAAYAGFKAVRPELIALAGIDILTPLQPYDIHLNGDAWCGPYSAGFTGDAGQYGSWAGRTGVVSCFWDVEKLNRFLPFTPQNAVKREDQLLRVHEYGHGIFFGRHFYSYEDVVKDFSFYVAGINGRQIKDACDPYQINPSQGRLLYTLCRTAGFNWPALAPALQELDRLYRSGGGEALSSFAGGLPVTTPAQLRKILSDQLGRDTSDGFVAAYIPPGPTGAELNLSPSGGRLSLAASTVTLALPAGAVSTDHAATMHPLLSTPHAAGAPYIDFQNALRLLPADIPFSKPARLSLRYDPIFFPVPGIHEGSLQFYRYVGNAWQVMPGSRVDVVDRVVSAEIPGTGDYMLAGSTAPSTETAAQVVATVASLPGLGGSYFRTQVQIHNAGSFNSSGKLVYHPREASAGPSDPAYAYALGYRQTLSLPDLFASLGQTGNGSVDVISSTGTVPVVVTRVFNDQGAAGTFGVGEDAVSPEAALRAGDHGVLLAPPDATQRMNVGLRSLAGGVSLSITVRSATGDVVKTTAKSYPPVWFEQRSLAEFVPGYAFSGNESLDIVVTSGSALVYGASADNRTNDPSLQLLRSLARPGRFDGEPLTLPTVASTPGQFGSFFKTTAQIHNPFQTTVAGKLVFRRAGAAGAPNDPSLAYSLAPGRTISYADLLPAMGQAGSGSVDVVPSSGPAPLVIARVFNDGSKGTAGLQYEARTVWDALYPGDRGVLLVPPDLAKERFNIGVRSLSRGAHVTIRVFNADGRPQKVLTRDYPPDFFEQKSVADFLPGYTPAGGSSVEVWVEGGALHVYGAAGDNLTNDPTMQFAGRSTF